jgi:hypothetical protein
MLGVFVAIERSHPEPMLDLSLFKIPTMTPSLSWGSLRRCGWWSSPVW